jgi:hypothetical protein
MVWVFSSRNRGIWIFLPSFFRVFSRNDQFWMRRVLNAVNQSAHKDKIKSKCRVCARGAEPDWLWPMKSKRFWSRLSKCQILYIRDDRIHNLFNSRSCVRCADVCSRILNILHSRAHKLTCFPGRRDARCQETNFAQSHPILSLISLSFHNWYLMILCLFTHRILTIASETWRVLVALAVGLLIAQSDVRDPPPAASWTSPANRISETQ